MEKIRPNGLCPYCRSVMEPDCYSCYMTWMIAGGEVIYYRTFTCYERELSALKMEVETMNNCKINLGLAPPAAHC